MKSIIARDYAVAVGKDGAGVVKCLIVAVESVPEGGRRAVTAKHAYLKGGSLHLASPAGELILFNLEPAPLEAIKQSRLIVALDGSTGLSHRIDLVDELAAQPTPSQAPPKATNSGLPTGFFG